MLTIRSDGAGKFCDGHTRRSFLKIGGIAGLSFGGLSLPDLLRAEAETAAAGGTGASQPGHGSSLGHRAIINIFLPGGPPHQDMFDLKPDAPLEIRGEFRPIKTNVAGIEICELFPRLARISDKLTYIRSIVGATGDHYSFQCFTGRDHRRQPTGGWPSMGAALSKLAGPVTPGMPPFVGLSPKMGHTPWSDPGQPGFLGPAHGPFTPNRGDGQGDLVLNDISIERLGDRKALLASFDSFRRETDASGLMEGLDAFTQQAFGVLTSSRLAEALDLDSEPLAIRDRYGRGTPANQADGGPKLLDQFLLARRLVEAGVRCVTLAFSRWDWHGGNFNRGRQDMPMLDQGLSALVEDLHARGLSDDVSVVCWGEFGRTPKVNKDAGRDHWPNVSCAVLACGGMQHGQVIGTTTRGAEEAKDRPVHFQEVFATLYHALGIDPHVVTVRDLNGRPQYLVDSGYQPLPEVTV